MSYYMAIDQYGRTYHNLIKPRRDLLRRFNRKHADRMYVNKRSGSVCIGWIIAGLWLTVYEVKPMERPA